MFYQIPTRTDVSVALFLGSGTARLSRRRRVADRTTRDLDCTEVASSTTADRRLAESDHPVQLATGGRVDRRQEADPRRYGTLGLPEDPVASETWRDPFVLRDPGGDGCLLDHGARQGSAAGRRGHRARAQRRHGDLGFRGPPIGAPAGFGQLEVIQVRQLDGRPTLVFTCHPDEQTPDRRLTSGSDRTWSVPGESTTGPWDIARAAPFTAEPDLFAAPLVQDRDGQWFLLGFVNLEPKGLETPSTSSIRFRWIGAAAPWPPRPASGRSARRR